MLGHLSGISADSCCTSEESGRRLPRLELLEIGLLGDFLHVDGEDGVVSATPGHLGGSIGGGFALLFLNTAVWLSTLSTLHSRWLGARAWAGSIKALGVDAWLSVCDSRAVEAKLNFE